MLVVFYDLLIPNKPEKHEKLFLRQIGRISVFGNLPHHFVKVVFDIVL